MIGPFHRYLTDICGKGLMRIDEQDYCAKCESLGASSQDALFKDISSGCFHDKAIDHCMAAQQALGMMRIRLIGLDRENWAKTSRDNIASNDCCQPGKSDAWAFEELLQNSGFASAPMKGWILQKQIDPRHKKDAFLLGALKRAARGEPAAALLRLKPPRASSFFIESGARISALFGEGLQQSASAQARVSHIEPRCCLRC